MHKITLDKHVRLGWVKISPEAQKLFSMGSLDIFSSRSEKNMYVRVVDRTRVNKSNSHKLVMELNLRRIGTRTSWHVDLARLDHLYSGHSIAPKIYARLIKSIPGFIMEAGHLQSQGGRNIWVKLAQQSGLYVFAQNRKGAYPVDVNEELNELMCDQVKVYGTGTNVFAMAI